MIWAYAPEFRIILSGTRGAAKASSGDAGSLEVIVYGMWAAWALAGFLSSVLALRFPDRAIHAVFWFGLLAIVAGSLLRRHCWRMLGRSFTGDVAARPDQIVIERGAYRWVRHPSYAAGTLMNIGAGLALGSWASTLVLAAGSIAVYLYRIAVEERVLLQTIGEPYRLYISRRKRLIPYIY